MPEMAPHEKAEDKQNATCADCKWNAFKSDDRGKGKACKNIRRLALIHADSLDSPQAVAKAQVAFLNIPVTSVKGWANYVRTLANVMKRPPYGMVTQVEAQPDDATQFRLLFEPLAKITDGKLLQAIHALRQKVAADLQQPYPENAAPATTRKTKQRAKVGRR